jgi:hypothetical protein
MDYGMASYSCDPKVKTCMPMLENISAIGGLCRPSVGPVTSSGLRNSHAWNDKREYQSPMASSTRLCIPSVESEMLQTIPTRTRLNGNMQKMSMARLVVMPSSVLTKNAVITSATTIAIVSAV